MTHDEAMAEQDRLARIIVDAGLRVHGALGPGLPQSAYEHALARELGVRGLSVAQQVPLAIMYQGTELDTGYRLDLVVGDDAIIEVKAVERLLPVHDAQLRTYLHLSGRRIGFLMNFHVIQFEQGLKRLSL